MAESKTSSFGQKLMEAACKISTLDAATADANAEIWSEGLLIKPRTGRTIYIPYTETTAIEPANYRVKVSRPSTDVLLSQIGIKYEGFQQKLVEARGEALVRAMLMKEPNMIYQANALCSYTLGDTESSGPCRAEIYPTSLILMFSDKLPVRVPLALIQSSDAENFRLKLTTSKKGTIELSKMGTAFQYFSDNLTEARRALEATALDALVQMLPSATSDEIETVSILMPEGSPARRRDIEAISQKLWRLLETRVAETPLAETYKYLSSIGEPEYAAIGLKKTMETTYVWFLMPILGSLQTGGNTLSMEIVTETGHATYLFRVLSRKTFASAPQEDFFKEIEHLIETLSDSMIATGFRREPIYLDDEKLLTETYRKYLFAASNLPELKLLRGRFYARTIHTTFENWKQSLSEALRFNTSAQSDVERWGSSDAEPEEKTQEQQD